MNVVWIVADTLRREALGAYGNQVVRTPALDALAAKSMRFDRHYAGNFPTMPARADFLTGRWTMSFLFWEPLPEGVVVLPQLLGAEGVHTAAFVDTPFFIRNGMNYDRGFQTFCEIPGQTNNLDQNPELRQLWRYESDRFAPRTFNEAMKWLERHQKEDFFLYIDTWDPHEPWEAPNYYTELYWPGYDGEIIAPCYGRGQDAPGFTEEKLKKAYASYCGEITMVDTWTGRLLRHLENLNLTESTAIVFTTDHGFYFGEHGGMFGKMSRAVDENGRPVVLWDEDGKAMYSFETELWGRSPLYEESIAIPLFIYTPGIRPGTYKGLTSAVDLMPTVLELMGKSIPSFVEGESLLGRMKNPTLPGRSFVVSTHQFVNTGESVRSVDDQVRKMYAASSTTVTTEDWALLYEVEQGKSELYHLASDPKQENNCIGEYPEKAHELHQSMVRLMRETGAPATALAPRSELRL